MAMAETYPEIREGIRKVCEGFPGVHRRDLDRDTAYPSAFVQALTDAGYLAEHVLGLPRSY